MGAILFSARQDSSKKGAKGAKKAEVARDWQGDGGYVALVVRADDKTLSVADLLPDSDDAGKYQANIFRKFDVANDKPVAALQGVASGSTVAFTGDGWNGSIADGHFKATKNAESFDLQHITRTPLSSGAKPPAGATVLFDGAKMNLWARMKEKDWLTEDGPSPWHMVPVAAMEVVPRAGCLISRKQFGDCKIHVEFRTLGGPTNSGVYIQDRYEANINEMYGRLDGNPRAGFDNCTPADAKPGIRCSRRWSGRRWTSIFRAPRFDASGKRTAGPRVTLLFNGTPLYTDRELGPVTLNAARLGEAPTGPIQLQEHGMPVQFRNIWVVER